MPKNNAPHTAIAVFTGKSVENILRDGGSSSWVLDRNHAIHREYLVCCRSNIEWVEGPELPGSAFLVGRISDVVPSKRMEGRWTILIKDFARVSIPEAWQGWRNPVRYTDLESLGIDPAALSFEPMPAPQSKPKSAKVAAAKAGNGSLTITEAKRGLAKTFGVNEDAVEITIRG